MLLWIGLRKKYYDIFVIASTKIGLPVHTFLYFASECNNKIEIRTTILRERNTTLITNVLAQFPFLPPLSDTNYDDGNYMYKILLQAQFIHQSDHLCICHFWYMLCYRRYSFLSMVCFLTEWNKWKSTYSRRMGILPWNNEFHDQYWSISVWNQRKHYYSLRGCICWYYHLW